MMMTIVKRLIIYFFLVVTCVACSNSSKTTSVNEQYFQLQTVPDFLHNKVILESLVFKASNNQKLLTQLEFTSDSINMVAMTYSGLPIIQAKWRAEVGIEQLVSQHFKKDIVLRIIRDVQWVKWPLPFIQHGLLSGYEISEFNDNKNNMIRTIKVQNKVLVKITYIDNKVVLQNFDEEYELLIEQLNDK